MASAGFDTLCCRLYLDGYFEYLDGYLDTDDKSLFLADQLVLWPVLALTLSAADCIWMDILNIGWIFGYRLQVIASYRPACVGASAGFDIWLFWIFGVYI